MEVKGLAARFREDWERAIEKVELLHGASAGVLRALRAHADVDVAETVETIQDHASSHRPQEAAAFSDVWLGWYPEYVRLEVARLLPDLKERWPTAVERWKENASRQKRKRWCEDGARIVVRLADGRWHEREQVREAVGLQPGRFGRLVGVLTHVDAVRLRDNLLLAVASPEWAREKMHALSPSI